MGLQKVKKKSTIKYDRAAKANKLLIGFDTTTHRADICMYNTCIVFFFFF